MVRSDFTEFSYGFAALNELVAQFPGTGGLHAAPMLPTLRDENRLGYDARLESVHGVFFLQFKCAIRLTRPRAKQWPAYGQPYYAFDLRNKRRSPQHDALCRLQSALPFAGHVAYVASGFHTLAQLNVHFRDATVLRESVWVSPLAIGRTRIGASHRVCYIDAHDQPLRFSDEPVPVESMTFSDVASLAAGWAEERPIDVGELVAAVSNALTGFKWRGRPLEDPFDELRRLAWATADTQVVFVGRRRGGEPPIPQHLDTGSRVPLGEQTFLRGTWPS